MLSSKPSQNYTPTASELKPVGRSRMRGLKRVLSAEHQDWQTCLKRQDALLEIERRTLTIQAMLDAPIWEPS